MGRRRYLKDYRLENVTDKNGKNRISAVYRGDWHAFTGEAGQVKSCARSFALLALAQLALFLMAVFTNAQCSRTAYVMIPFAFIPLPLFFACAGAVNLLAAKERFTREANDHIESRTRRSPMALMILSGLSALAHIPYAIAIGEAPQDIVYLAAALGIFAAAFAQHRLRSQFETERLPEEGESAPDR